MEVFVSKLMNWIWNPLIYLCLGTGIYFSVLTKFPQVRGINQFKKLLFAKNDGEGISAFQAFSIAISGRVGTGNIAGVATAIYFGGPGSIFWMWAIAFLGAASAFVESALGQVWKEKDGEIFRGGPAYYIEKGMKCKWYANLFAIVTVLSVGVLLPGVQGNTIVNTLDSAFGLNKVLMTTILCITLGLIIFGGVKRIAKVAEVVVPIMAIGYILLALIVIAVDIKRVPEIFKLIITSAFNQNAVYGGIFGSAVMWGVKRGIFSNEAGQGTGPHAAAAANGSHPAKQGYVQAFSVYVDTLFVCTASAVMMLLTGMYNVIGPDGKFITENLPGTPVGSGFVQAGLKTIFGSLGPYFVGIALTFFAFTTIMAYYYIAETNLFYLIKNKNLQNKVIQGLRVIFVSVTFITSLKSATLVWDMGDIGVGMMAWINLIAIIILTKPALALIKDYDRQYAEGKDPVFDPRDCGIEGADLWIEIKEEAERKKLEAAQETPQDPDSSQEEAEEDLELI